MTTSILSPKFQIVIPKEIRRSLKLEPGQRLQIIAADDHIEIRPILAPSQLIGYLREGEPLDFEREPDREL